ncbi:hypothetical protein B0T22DRAFT_536826 [Podospora appendiculata]|uniref:Protein SQS1 n=1 Tax=Podospora appendiculata TaxID=314037 RepID=A0AAE0XCP9_9PEZI|nr:hypothetical protein B0T22DRAFT_536826 [Podospora appendiculata]
MPRGRGGKRPTAGAKASRNRFTAAQSSPSPQGTPGRSRNFQSPGPSRYAPNGNGGGNGMGHAFTMQDEARNTRSHESGWDSKLRSRPVAFISAGCIEPLKDINAPPDPPDAPVEKPASEDDDDDDEDETEDEEGVDDMGSQETEPIEVDADGVEDVILQISQLIQGTAPEAVDQDLDQDMFSPEIVNKGKQLADPIDDLIDELVSQDIPVARDVPMLEPPPVAEPPRELFFFDLKGDKSIIPPPQSAPEDSDSSEDIILFKGRSGKGGKGGRHARKSEPTGTEARKSGCQAPAARETASTPRAGDASSSQSRQKHPSSHPSQMQVDLEPEEDGEDAILRDYIENMAANSDEDFTVPHPLELTFNSGRELGGEHGAFVPAGDDDTSDPGNGDSDASDDGDMDEEDDEDLDGSDIDDEELARLFIKQEEMGMRSDELVLFSQAYYKTGKKSKKPVVQARALARANTSLVADAFNDLDLDDWNSPNAPKHKGKQSKRPPAFNVSDSELELALNTAWTRDRERKKNRKLEREELRVQGLLGKNVNPEDMRVKYRLGMKLDDIKAELVTFLLGSVETVQFPPLDKQARKILHELASKFKIKSQSTGSGDNRRPVLYRTKHTSRYAQSAIMEVTSQVDAAAVRIHRRYFHRIDTKFNSPFPKAPGAGGGGGRRAGGSKAVTYQDGEIAGASAPQLGQENKGHAMMEKMGWSKGMALGSIENKGILVPVVQVVKRSKAGLG